MNHGQDIPAYGLWSLMLINSAVFIIFAFSFFKPKTKRDWRTFGGFSALLTIRFLFARDEILSGSFGNEQIHSGVGGCNHGGSDLAA